MIILNIIEVSNLVLNCIECNLGHIELCLEYFIIKSAILLTKFLEILTIIFLLSFIYLLYLLRFILIVFGNVVQQINEWNYMTAIFKVRCKGLLRTLKVNFVINWVPASINLLVKWIIFVKTTHTCILNKLLRKINVD